MPQKCKLAGEDSEDPSNKKSKLGNSDSGVGSGPSSGKKGKGKSSKKVKTPAIVQE